MHVRELERHELESIWRIDRSEAIQGVYCLEEGALVLRPKHHRHPGWSADDRARYGPQLVQCFDRGGTFFGGFEGSGLIAVAVLDRRFIGKSKDQLQLVFLHVDRGFRARGVGATLFEMSVRRARDLGARKLYILSTPSENAVGFYLGLGCTLAEEIDPILFELEPDDIHLEYVIP